MKYILIVLFMTMIQSASAQERWIDIEWEPVTGARDYEVELFQDVDGKETPRGKYKTDAAVWSHSVTPGKYSLRIRSLDSRGVPGEWSENIPLKVRLKNPQLLRPIPNDQIALQEVKLEWSEVEGAKKYQVILKSGERQTILNSVTEEFSLKVPMSSLGKFEWTVIALEADESSKDEKDIPQNTFRSFDRVGGELEAPFVGVKLTTKVTVSWNKVRNAQAYEMDYFPPKGSSDKNRRFRLKTSPLSFSRDKLRDGVTTLALKALSPGYEDSKKSVIQLYRSGDKVEVQEIIQGKDDEVIKENPSSTQWRNQYFTSIQAGQYNYSSKDAENDTELKQQKLTGLGVNLDWHFRPKLNSFLHKMEFSIVNLSNGIDSGQEIKLGYSLNNVMNLGRGFFHYGAGLTYLRLPSFMGNRFQNKVVVENSASAGPQVNLAYVYPLAATWVLEAQTQISYQAYYLSSDRKKEESFAWARARALAYKYFTEKEAFFFGADVQTWTQTWGKDESRLLGISFILGIKGGF